MDMKLWFNFVLNNGLSDHISFVFASYKYYIYIFKILKKMTF